MKFKLHKNSDGIVEYEFRCPGCGYAHLVRTQGPRPCWKWDGSLDRPTISPSLLVGPGTSSVCHSFITNGNIQFLNDCWHKVAGQTVEIPDWRDDDA